VTAAEPADWSSHGSATMMIMIIVMMLMMLEVSSLTVNVMSLLRSLLLRWLMMKVTTSSLT